MDDNLMWSCDKDKMQKSILHIRKYLRDCLTSNLQIQSFCFVFLNQIYKNNKQTKVSGALLAHIKLNLEMKRTLDNRYNKSCNLDHTHLRSFRKTQTSQCIMWHFDAEQ